MIRPNTLFPSERRRTITLPPDREREEEKGEGRGQTVAGYSIRLFQGVRATWCSGRCSSRAAAGRLRRALEDLRWTRRYRLSACSEPAVGNELIAKSRAQPTITITAPNPHLKSTSTHTHGSTAVVHHAHRSLAEISRVIERSALSPAAQSRAKELFNRLGEAEAAIHQMPLEKIHLHEVGEIDSIIDIVGAVFALEWFGADQIISSPLNVGGGMVQSAHGNFPVPAPATVKLLAGAPVYSSGVQSELVTPTGALLVTGYASSYGPVPAMTIGQVGYGAGDRDLPNTPNVLRVLVGESTDHPGTERIVVVECEIDDMNPQLFGLVMDRLYAAGALEVFFASVQMKKNRPGTLLTILARPEQRQELSSIVFRETTTMGCAS